MAVHSEITSSEAADRLAIRELFDAYAHCADRRDPEGEKALVTPSAMSESKRLDLSVSRGVRR
jgi:hypothetical protein